LGGGPSKRTPDRSFSWGILQSLPIVGFRKIVWGKRLGKPELGGEVHIGWGPKFHEGGSVRDPERL